MLWRLAVAGVLRSQLHQRPSSKHPWLPYLLHYSDSASRKGKAAPLQERRMRDRVSIWAKGGEGGNGCWSYRRTRTDRYGKPDGGNGGRGGDVILECSGAVWDFSNLQHHLNGKKGGNGISKNKIGSRGSDKVVQVPVGTVIHLVSGDAPSFVVDTSIKSLQPWEIPDNDQIGPSKSLQHSENHVSSVNSLDKEATGDSPSPQPKGYVGKSDGLHHKVSETPGSTGAKGKANFKHPSSHHEADDKMIKVEEFDEDEIKFDEDEIKFDENEIKFEEGSEEEDNDDTDDSSSSQSKGYVRKPFCLTGEKKRPIIRKHTFFHYGSGNRKMRVEEYEIKFDDGSEEEEDHEAQAKEYGEYCDEEYEKEYEEEEEEVEYSVAELTKPGQRLVVARGGEGGRGNVAVRHNPALREELKDIKSRKNNMHDDVSSDMELEESENNSSLTTGMPGSEAVLILELKSIADVGLVGMPNAGKSTLLGAISRAKPTVGHYAFTTLRPNIGNLNYDDFFSVSVADIPGLIKGAHENRGLGHAFLRHIERTKVLAYVVDLAAALNGGKGIPPWEQLRDLVMELEHHQEGLSQRPSLVVANKIDEEGAEDVFEELKGRVKGVPIFPVCAVLEEGVPELKAGLRRLMDGSESQCLDISRIMLD